jgi:hypothetical protein
LNVDSQAIVDDVFWATAYLARGTEMRTPGCALGRDQAYASTMPIRQVANRQYPDVYVSASRNTRGHWRRIRLLPRRRRH